ncbi:MAG: hypothetical protein SAK29_39655 [Scytonema sp. PMC 1069.18]|nr:hypothetical protein [Scytonema sp. PMC 1069.18]MEC4880618.1 hypothetical protein [Scytonema sp. PMC 1070.18]
MKDNLSLFAAATGGLMLSVALAGILQGSPVVASQGQHSFHSMTPTTLRPAKDKEDAWEQIK